MSDNVYGESKKVNPMFVVRKNEHIEKLNEEVAPERVVRKDWSNVSGSVPKLAKNVEAVEVDSVPSLSNDVVEGELVVSVSEPVVDNDDSVSSDDSVSPVDVSGKVVNSQFSFNPKPRVVKPVEKVETAGEGATVNVPFKGAVRIDGLRKPVADELKKDQRPSRLKAKSNIDAEEWDLSDRSDSEFGLNANTDRGVPEPEVGAGFHLTERDIEIIRFLARYRYAYNFQVARYLDTTPKAINLRLRKLADKGFVRRKTVTGNQYIWLSTKMGNLVADVDLKAVPNNELSFVTMAHSVGLCNIGTELERRAPGGKDLLGEQKYGRKWHVDDEVFNLKGEPVIGVKVLTEKEIRQGQQKWRMGRTTAEMREEVEKAIREGSPVVNEAGEIVEPAGVAPETLEGNEGLFVIYGETEHIPDMVIRRGRDELGNPLNIAIELELTPKTTADWRKILRAYRDYGIGKMYQKVIYFTHKSQISRLLNKINEEDVHLTVDEVVELPDGSTVVKEGELCLRKYVPVNGNIPFWG